MAKKKRAIEPKKLGDFASGDIALVNGRAMRLTTVGANRCFVREVYEDGCHGEMQIVDAETPAEMLVPYSGGAVAQGGDTDPMLVGRHA